eukprot:gene16424-18059_t
MQEAIKTLHNKCVPMKEISTGEKCYTQTAIVGDQGTVERRVNIFLQFSYGFDAKERPEGIHFQIADFHGATRIYALGRKLFAQGQVPDAVDVRLMAFAPLAALVIKKKIDEIPKEEEVKEIAKNLKNQRIKQLKNKASELEDQLLNTMKRAVTIAKDKDDACLDIKARGFYRLAQPVFFDVRVANLNAKSQSHLTTEKFIKNGENDEKRAYNQRIIEVEQTTFTPLVFGIIGSMGKECQIFHKKLALKLSAKSNKKYSEVISDIRTEISLP